MDAAHQWPQLLSFPVAPLVVLAQVISLLVSRRRLRLIVMLAAPALIAFLLLAVVSWGFDDDDSSFYGSLSAFVYLTLSLGASLLLTAAYGVGAAIGRAGWTRAGDAAWAKRAIWAAGGAVVLGFLIPPLFVLLAGVSAVAAVLSWRREQSRLRFAAAGSAALVVVTAAGVVASLVVDGRGAGGTSPSSLSSSERKRCAARGDPVTVRELVRIFRANGISLTIDDDGCRGWLKQPPDPAVSDATNAGPSGVELDDETDAREGHILCSVGDEGSYDADVEITKYPTDTETYLSAFNVECSVYPSSDERERAQVRRVRRALEALRPVAAR